MPDDSSTTLAHPDLASEQASIDRAYNCLRFMRERAIHLKSLGYQGGNLHADVGVTPEMAAADDARKQRRVDSLAEPTTALCFGRIDRGEDRFYIGRRHVEDEHGEPVVTDWRAPAAVGFYRATVADRMGLRLRRRFVVERRELLDIFEEHLENPESDVAGSYVPDPLLAEIGRTRTRTMRDIVSTIQAEQDRIIRAPLDACTIVQGGPGTGKTAVGLHRVAYLLYNHREDLERSRVLIVGPNRIFFRYISQVLPSLGETAAVQLTIEGLTSGGYWVRGLDSPALAALRGDRRMALIIQNAARDRIAAEPPDIQVTTSHGTVALPSSATAGIVKRALDASRPLNDARSNVRDQLIDLAWRGYLRKPGSDHTAWGTFTDQLRSNKDFKRALDRLWPALSAPDLVRKLFGNRRLLERASVGILTNDERALLGRKPSARLQQEQWTTADLALLDEANAALHRTTHQYGHIVVDEAQDLSDMQLRVIARRARSGSMTVLGDLAQASAPAAQANWGSATAVLGAPNTRFEELTVGYRVPAPILEYANRLLASAAPDVTPTRSARAHGTPPRLVPTTAAQLAETVVGEAVQLANTWTSTAIVAPAEVQTPIVEAMTAAGIDFTDGTRISELGEHLTLLAPATTKGLEFDAVIAVEPARIAEIDRGLRLLYIVLTRAVQELVIVHAEDLPAQLDNPR
ncbi:MAG TPA: UvrD-helicase domain-containing protein [Acidimicrobiales bacterium]|nr:UvrD-helicase domain-containing protein [Acidimicrobiales bacterium]